MSAWIPSPTYYSSLLDQLVKGMLIHVRISHNWSFSAFTITGLEPFSISAPSCDWQCSEFSGSLPLSLTCACVELLALPLAGKQVGNHLLNALYKMAAEKDSEEDILALVNALALLFISLPVSNPMALVLHYTSLL